METIVFIDGVVAWLVYYETHGMGEMGFPDGGWLWSGSSPDPSSSLAGSALHMKYSTAPQLVPQMRM